MNDFEEASRKVWDENMARFEIDSMKALTDKEDVKLSWI